MWNFTKIPKEKRNEFEELYENKNFTGLVLFHNRYDLSDYDYCCGDDKKSVFKWAKYIIDEWRREQGS